MTLEIYCLKEMVQFELKLFKRGLYVKITVRCSDVQIFGFVILLKVAEWNDVVVTASVAPGIGLNAPSKLPHRL